MILALLTLTLLAFFVFNLDRTAPAGGLLGRIRYVMRVRGQAGELRLLDRKGAMQSEKETHLKAARDIASKAEAENREFTAEERTQVMALMEQAKAVHARILEADGDAKMLDELNILGRPLGELAKGAGPAASSRKSVGQQFIDNSQFKAWQESIGAATKSEHGRVGQSPAVSFDSKALLTGVSDTSAGALVQTERLGLQDVGTFMRPLVIRNLVTNGTTGSDAVEYARVTGFTNAAAPVAEATSDVTIGDGTGGTVTAAAGGLKPKSSMTLEKVTAVVKTVAHWLPATKRALSDAAQIRTLIDNFLTYGLEEELEDQIINGDNTGENFEGVLEVSGTQAQAWDTNLFVTTRKARRKVRQVGRAVPTAFVFNPEDNERIDLATDGTDRFYGNGPFGLGPDVLWGLPRVESEAVPVGTGLVGAWNMAVLWDREQAAIQVSDSHADFFVRNLVAILAEMRAAFGILRPKAFVIIDLTA